MSEHHFPVQIYYEDTDVGGLVYHSHYLNYFERARSNIFGVKKLVELLDTKGIGYVVHNINMTFNDSVKFGDVLDIATSFKKDGDYKVIFHQEAWVENAKKAAVIADIELLCIDKNKNLQPVDQFPELNL